MRPSAGGGPAAGELFFALDVGTQSIRTALVDLAGGVLSLVKTPIEPYFSARPGWAEQHPEYYWEKLAESCRQLWQQAGPVADRVVAVTLTTQRATFVNVDRNGTPLRPAIVWLDQRRADPAQVLPFFAPPILRLLGVQPLVEYAVGYSRSNWLRQHEPGIWAATHKFLCLSGYLTHQLTGEFRDSAANMIGALPFDVKRFGWASAWDLKWRLFPVEREKLPDLVLPGEDLGVVTAEAAAATGLPAGLPLVAAANDKACEMLGAGCLAPDTAFLSFGTTATINTQNPRYVELKKMMPPFPSAIPHQFYSEIGVLRGLWMVSWFKQEFGLQERLQSSEGGQSPEALFDALIRDVPPGSMGLMLQPYWTPGPDLERSAKGSIIGFGDVHTRAHLYRAIIEGLAYALKDGARLTEERNGVKLERMRAAGGGSQSDQILQVTADVFGLPVHRPHTHETAVVGAAIDAAVGRRFFPDFPTAVAAMTHERQIFEPIPTHVRLYGDLYERVYRKMYERLQPLFEEIREITGYPE